MTSSMEIAQLLIIQSICTSVVWSWPSYKPVKAGVMGTHNNILERRKEGQKREMIDLSKVMQVINESQIHSPDSHLEMSTCLQEWPVALKTVRKRETSSKSKMLTRHPRSLLISQDQGRTEQSGSFPGKAKNWKLPLSLEGSCTYFTSLLKGGREASKDPILLVHSTANAGELHTG